MRTHGYVHDPVQWIDPMGLAGCYDAKAGRWRDAKTGRFTKIPKTLPDLRKGDKVFRVYGGDARPDGASWSTVNPGNVPNYRNTAGLPSGGASGANNTGRFVIEGVVDDPSKVVLKRTALPLDGMKGGLPEYIIPNPYENGAVKITHVSGVNPEF